VEVRVLPRARPERCGVRTASLWLPTLARVAQLAEAPGSGKIKVSLHVDHNHPRSRSTGHNTTEAKMSVRIRPEARGNSGCLAHLGGHRLPPTHPERWTGVLASVVQGQHVATLMVSCALKCCYRAERWKKLSDFQHSTFNRRPLESFDIPAGGARLRPLGPFHFRRKTCSVCTPAW
jgi:hypothetical protein